MACYAAFESCPVFGFYAKFCSLKIKNKIHSFIHIILYTTVLNNFCMVLTLISCLLRGLECPSKVSQVSIGKKDIQTWYFGLSTYGGLLVASLKRREKLPKRPNLAQINPSPLLLVGVKKCWIWWHFSFIIWVWRVFFINDFFQKNWF